MLKEKLSKRKILDIGCGDKKLSGKENFSNYNFIGDVIGLDLNKTRQTDIVYDLNKGKLPFKNNDFDIVYTSHCLEHVQNIVPLLLDIYRILKKGGHLLIRVPHVSYIDSLGDLTHVRLFSYSSLDFLFFKYHQQLRNDEIFKLIKRKIVFGKFYSYGLVLCNIVIV